MQKAGRCLPHYQQEEVPTESRLPGWTNLYFLHCTFSRMRGKVVKNPVSKNFCLLKQKGAVMRTVPGIQGSPHTSLSLSLSSASFCIFLLFFFLDQPALSTLRFMWQMDFHISQFHILHGVPLKRDMNFCFRSKFPGKVLCFSMSQVPSLAQSPLMGRRESRVKNKYNEHNRKERAGSSQKRRPRQEIPEMEYQAHIQTFSIS